MNKNDIRESALAYVRAHNMLKQHDKVVAGISGGADSMCLLGLLLDWRDLFDLEIYVLHVNHGIRGKAADADERFVEDYCRDHGIGFGAVHADVPKLARSSGCTEEEAGRNLRYEEFRKKAEELGYNRIAVAHNRSDNAETVIFNMLRGSGISGLKGISPVREIGGTGISIIRPLLNTSREDIESYLEQNGQDFRTDETNNEMQYSRNTIRNVIMPMFKGRINSASEEHITRLAAQAAELEEFVRKAAETELRDMEENGDIRSTDGETKSYRIDIGVLKGKEDPIVKMIVRDLMGRLAGGLKDIGNIHIEDVVKLLEKQSGKRIDLPYGIEARREHDDLVLEKSVKTVQGGFALTIDKRDFENRTEDDPLTIELPEDNAGGYGILKLYVTEPADDFDFTKNLCTKFFDCDKIKNSVTIRTRRTGDYLLIRGHGGSGDTGLVRKSLKSWMIDNKIPLRERDRYLLAAEGDHVLWILGLRRDDSAPVLDDTVKVLVTELADKA